jgi:small-conductance mechanosensitive channel
VAAESQFFITYVFITGGMSTFFFMSQMHNVAKQWFVYKVMNKEASSQRTLDDIESSVKVLHKFELLPIALFIFIIGVLYGAIAPLASVFVVAYFRCTYKAFKYMMLFYYGKFYENGGQLFYYISTIIFLILYLVVLIIVGYLSLHGTAAMAGVSCVMLLIIVVTQLHVHRTFVQPSRTLSLAKARIIDDEKYSRNHKHRKLNSYRRGDGRQQDDCDENRRRPVDNSLIDSLLEHAVHDVDDEETQMLSDDSLDTTSLMERELADKRMQERYQEHDSSVSDVTDEYASASDFFIYRQPSLNRVTWELAPRPYRKRLDRDYDCEIWR